MMRIMVTFTGMSFIVTMCCAFVPASSKVFTSVGVNQTSSGSNVYSASDRMSDIGNGAKNKLPRTVDIQKSDEDDKKFHQYLLPASYAYILPSRSKGNTKELVKPVMKSSWLNNDDTNDNNAAERKGDKNEEDNVEYVTPEQMMTIMSAVLQTRQDKPEDNTSSLLAKLTEDPVVLLVALSLPIAILLAAVLPVLLSNYLGNSNNSSMIISTNAGRRSDLDVLEKFASPVLHAVAKGLNNPLCIERIICDTIQDQVRKSNNNSFFNNTIGFASTLARGTWLESSGITTIIKHFSDGKCTNMKCPTQKPSKGGNGEKTR